MTERDAARQSTAIIVHEAKRTATSTRTTHTRQNKPFQAAAVQQRRCPQLSYSLAKRLVDLMVEPISFDRIGNLGKSSTMKARLQEEVWLVEIAQGTRVRDTEMGVFSAVAGNH